MNDSPTSKHVNDARPNTDNELGQDLHWDAFRYVAGDMQTDEVQAFETRLEDDQQAREAVAAAVELGSVLSVRDDTPVVTRRPRPAMLGWLCVGVSACLVLAWLTYQPTVPPQQTAPISDNATAQSPTDAAKLAMLWSETREEIASSGESAEFWRADAEEPMNAALAVDGTDSMSDIVTPDWMLAGIKSLEESETSLSDDMDMNLDEGEES